MIKKGAMFGLFRVLRKQSGRLFLAKRQSADSQETRGSFKTNRGAMFGLDARIALAIFGALSVISGAALYSAIKEAKVTAFLVKLEEISKAIDAYRIDVGREVVTGTNGIVSNGGVLVKDYDSDLGWKGPYLSYDPSTSAVKFIMEGKKVFTYSSGDRSTGISVLSNGKSCLADKACDIYIKVAFVSADNNVAEGVSLFNELDQKLDGGDGYKSGRIHAIQADNSTAIPDPDASSFNLLYKVGPYVFR